MKHLFKLKLSKSSNPINSNAKLEFKSDIEFLMFKAKFVKILNEELSFNKYHKRLVEILFKHEYHTVEMVYKSTRYEEYNVIQYYSKPESLFPHIELFYNNNTQNKQIFFKRKGVNNDFKNFNNERLLELQQELRKFDK